MSRSKVFDHLIRIARIADYCETRGISTKEGSDRAAALELQRSERRAGRREFLKDMGKLAAVGAVGSAAGSLERVFAAQPSASDVNIGIVGAGLAGLVCADELKKNRIQATIFDANTRAGGRCWSLRNFFRGQVAERGGEFIDTPHKTLLGYAKQFNLALEDVGKQPGEVFYFFDGQHYPEAAVVDEYRALVAAMRDDLRQLSNEPTADQHSDADVALDTLNLQDYLQTRAAGPLIGKMIEQAYKAEYGREIAEQSCLNFLLFIHADRRSKFTPFGIFSDERYHVVDGNDRIVEGLTRRLHAQIEFEMKLLRVLKTASGKIELTFAQGLTTRQATFDAVVLALPFSTLREVDLDSSLGLPSWKVNAIQSLGYGTNAKMMIGFNGRPWIALGSNGASYSDLPNHQATWETNPSRSRSSRGLITDYSSGVRGASLDVNNLQGEALSFLDDLDLVFPGAFTAATRDSQGNFRAHLEHWPSNPLSKGSYTCYLPGQFTTIAGNEGKPIGNLHFAGEHANSFYEWQGFMEGAALSGIQAAQEILHDLKVGVLG
jgi:monoamine oxidase